MNKITGLTMKSETCDISDAVRHYKGRVLVFLLMGIFIFLGGCAHHAVDEDAEENKVTAERTERETESRRQTERNMALSPAYKAWESGQFQTAGEIFENQFKVDLDLARQAGCIFALPTDGCAKRLGEIELDYSYAADRFRKAGLPDRVRSVSKTYIPVAEELLRCTYESCKKESYRRQISLAMARARADDIDAAKGVLRECIASGPRPWPVDMVKYMGKEDASLVIRCGLELWEIDRAAPEHAQVKAIARKSIEDYSSEPVFNYFQFAMLPLTAKYLYISEDYLDALSGYLAYTKDPRQLATKYQLGEIYQQAIKSADNVRDLKARVLLEQRRRVVVAADSLLHSAKHFGSIDWFLSVELQSAAWNDQMASLYRAAGLTDIADGFDKINEPIKQKEKEVRRLATEEERQRKEQAEREVLAAKQEEERQRARANMPPPPDVFGDALKTLTQGVLQINAINQQTKDMQRQRELAQQQAQQRQAEAARRNAELAAEQRRQLNELAAQQRQQQQLSQQNNTGTAGADNRSTNASSAQGAHRERVNLPGQTGCISFSWTHRDENMANYELKNNCPYPVDAHWCNGTGCNRTDMSWTIPAGGTTSSWLLIKQGLHVGLFKACQLMSGNDNVLYDGANDQCYAMVFMQ